MKKIEMSKTYRYANGEPARILCTDAPGDHPVVSLSQAGKLFRHTPEGYFYDEDCSTSYDLIEVAEPIVGYINIWESPSGDHWTGEFIWSSEKEARTATSNSAFNSEKKVAVARIEYTPESADA